MGALGGAAQGMETVRARRLQEEELRRRDEQQASQNSLQLEAAARASRAEQRQVDDGLRTRADEMIGMLRPGETVNPSVVPEVQRLGLGHRIEETRTLPSSRFEGLMPLPGSDVGGSMSRTQTLAPRGTGQFTRRETGAERTTREAAEATARAEQERLRQRDELLRRRPDLAETFAYGDVTGKVPLNVPLAPEVIDEQARKKREQERDDWQFRENYSHGLGMKRLSAEEWFRQQRESASQKTQPKGPKDDPALPHGVRRAIDQYADEMSDLDNTSDAAAAVRDRVADAWDDFVRDHPNLDPAKVEAYIESRTRTPRPVWSRSRQADTSPPAEDDLTRRAQDAWRRYQAETDPARKQQLLRTLRELHAQRGAPR